MSLNSFQLKGGGWYVTDYKGKNSSTAAPVESPASTDSAPKTDTAAKKETKPKAAKADKS